MSCENCVNLKIRSMTYQELEAKWNELYHPLPITEGYKKRMMRESMRRGVALERFRFRYIYCSKGILSRFYLVRGIKGVKPKADVGTCCYYQ